MLYSSLAIHKKLKDNYDFSKDSIPSNDNSENSSLYTKPPLPSESENSITGDKDKAPSFDDSDYDSGIVSSDAADSSRIPVPTEIQWVLEKVFPALSPLWQRCSSSFSGRTRVLPDL
ncbi:MAG: hypothetical protein ACI4FN_03395 [Acutalibacteraceae bacterium]